MKERFEKLLRAAFELKASDIHITVGVPPIFRLHGDLKQYGKETMRPDDTEGMARAILSETLWEKFEETGEVDFSYGIPGVSRFRINAYHQRNCVSLAVRIVPTEIPTLDALHMPNVLREISEKPQGLVLVTGPTGSGKSTTLASMIDYMNNSMRRHIITLEDPIEYLHSHRYSIIDQREVGFDTNNFANGLRACLRQDPDVILVGEMRDLETISTAITAAETGHLVLGTLHTTGAASTIDRIIDVFPPNQQTQVRIQMASVLQAIVSQRLFQRKDKKGRRAATEVLMNTSAVKNLIRNEKIHQIPNIIQTSKAQGMHTLDFSVRALVEEGVITTEAAAPFLEERGQ
ncbi:MULTISPECIES: type IV pilus twitching motility protein PilT [Pontibacillus]|uniref:Type IV pilus twitching motility protein PilT n=1 Tax=Pontibacillus chungwhensis TaxID=265426 RepID=A0ABY8UUE5_9BACI|nr:type IV pilus twitching motility protein PilT [Pontibacillus chungwhensis]MCD5323736.1 type IV pilus twitching motility protein PilT [Pontibacillus sp. HN14]WIF97102.1 type IV pilus twitching motility protein PilT [Pontibacillus chungwhensis]